MDEIKLINDFYLYMGYSAAFFAPIAGFFFISIMAYEDKEDNLISLGTSKDYKFIFVAYYSLFFTILEIFLLIILFFVMEFFLGLAYSKEVNLIAMTELKSKFYHGFLLMSLFNFIFGCIFYKRGR